MIKTVLSFLVSLVLAGAAMPDTSASAASLQVTFGKPSSATNVAASKKARKKAAPARKAAKPRPPKPQPPVEVWNLPMTVVLVRSSVPGCEPLCPEWLAAEGRITEKTPAVFRKALQMAGKRWLPVVIRSPGGDVKAAMDIGRMIRRAGLPVGVGWTLYDGCAPSDSTCKPPPGGAAYRGLALVGQSFCNSACPLVLAGGTQRFAGIGTAVGLHVMRRQWFKERITYREVRRASKGQQKIVRKVVSRKVVGTYFKEGIDKEYRRKILAYLAEMGIGSAYLEDMAKASYADIYLLTGDRMRELRLVTSADTVSTFTSPLACSSAVPSPNCHVLSQQVAAAQPSVSSLPSGEPMKVVRVRAQGTCEPLCPEWIAAQGVITPGSVAQFRRLLEESGMARLPVVVNSPGGDLDAALAIGHMVREQRLTVVVGMSEALGCKSPDWLCGHDPAKATPLAGVAHSAADCSGSCLFLLAGGIQRAAYWTKGVVLPPPEAFSTRKADAQAATLIQNYIVEMGISPWLIARTRHSGSPLDPKELEEVKLSLSRESAEWLTSPRRCAQSNPPEYCVPVNRAIAAKGLPGYTLTTKVGKAASAYRVRMTGLCEPTCPEWIAIEGVISKTLPRRLADLLAAAGNRKLPVFINSPGGDFDAALEIGSMIRSRGLETAVGETIYAPCKPGGTCGKFLPVSVPLVGRVAPYGLCDRECLFVLAGGLERWDAAAVSTLVAPPETLVTRRSGKTALELAKSYLRRMGVSTSVLTPKDGGSLARPVWLSDAERRSLGFGTKAAFPFALTDANACQPSRAQANCVRAIRRMNPSPGDPAIAVRMRRVASCEPSCPEWIMLRGTITPKTAKQFAAVVETLGQARVPVMLDSPGGDLDAAVEIGRLIRRRGLPTGFAASEALDCEPRDPTCQAGWYPSMPYSAKMTWGGRCDAACLLVLAGGTHRHSFMAKATLPPVSAFTTRRKGTSAENVIASYLKEMSMDAGLIQVFTDPGRTSAVTLTSSELFTYGLGDTKESPVQLSDPERCRKLPLAENCLLHFRPTGL